MFPIRKTKLNCVCTQEVAVLKTHKCKCNL